MREYLSIKDIIESLSLFPKDTVLFNAPISCHPYCEGNNIAMIAGDNLMDAKPASTVGLFVETLRSMIGLVYPNYTAKRNQKEEFVIEEHLPLYIVSSMHKPGYRVIGIQYTNSGITFLKEEHNWR